jgi:Na+/H+ antiporter NhaD/arsenite permease-like protein
MPFEDETPSPSLSPAQFAKRAVILILVSLGAALGCGLAGMTGPQQLAVGAFVVSILGTLTFWNLRLSVAFLGVSLLILTRSMTIEQYVWAAEVPIILFLIGMMIVLGCLEDLGFFTWVVQSIISLPHLTGHRLIAVISVVAALLACAVGEVISIIIIATLVFQVCGRLKVNPIPFIIVSVIATNIGSAGTMMGNPVGILIGAKAGFTFGDFLLWAFPVMLVATVANIGLVFFWYRKDLRVFDERLQEQAAKGADALDPRVRVPYRRSLTILAVVLLSIALHHQFEQILGLEKNTVLFIAPIFCAAGVMLYRRDRARHYVERSVDWWTLLFFMMLFSIAGTLKASGVTEVLAKNFITHFGRDPILLIAGILSTSALGSAVVDNVVFVAAFSPIIEGLKTTGVAVTPLWWALLFGACFGGNITLIGSTANIVALGMLEKQAHAHIRFKDWLKIGLTSAVLTCAIAGGAIILLRGRMAEVHSAPPALQE